MSDINRRILDAEKIEKQSRPEPKKRKWLRAKCAHCDYEVKYHPTKKFRGELRCPECGQVFKVPRLDFYLNECADSMSRSNDNSANSG